MSTTSIGAHIVIDPRVCDGAPTFRDTAVRVADVLEEVAQGTPWEEIIERRQGRVSRDAIAEALDLAGAVLGKHARVPPKRELDAPPTVLGEYIVADPAICHGAVTFRGTRIFVEDVVNQVARGMDWPAIVSEWRGSVTPEAIAESIRVAGRSFAEHARDHQLEPTVS
jgi:uncharacterized protein (DUF433 family)